MSHYHDQTIHTYESVRQGGRYVNWDAQPELFKTYPHFYRRVKLDEAYPLHRVILDAASVSLTREYGAKSVHLRIHPSAGALYPVELYVQFRGVWGMDNGIYHVDVRQKELVFIKPIHAEGLEAYLPDKRQVKGLMFLISAPYFRSSWKYGNRALRYCLLDSGHLLGALEAAAFLNDQNLEARLEIDRSGLNRAFGFENKELPMCAAVIGERGEKEAKKFEESLPFVSPTDYFEPNSFLEEAYQTCQQEPYNQCDTTSQTEWGYDKKHLSETVWNRRSIREFMVHPTSETEWESVIKNATQPFPVREQEEISFYHVVNRVEGIEPGLYRENGCVKTGDFARKAGYLCLEQDLGVQSGFTIFLTSQFKNYHVAMILAGWMGHRIYLAANYLGLGCSGIGAYYDLEVQRFLGSDERILYALAVGR